MSAQRRRPDDRKPSDEVPDVPVRTIDKILAYTALGLAGASVLCFFAIIIGTATGMSQEAFAHGAWPFIAGLPLYGLPLAFVMIIALLIMSFVRKGRAAKRS
ncbi:multidrug ABC transporter ATPase [Microbacterium sp. KUDC0406]|uniref:multidrug ABC transporter ATPase n=1 Tax=Microbacterium sp. KUDC0406 TaxID=2909588 RepID=UPI001F1DDED1|nr:multidrug ABC transporter ATPase [Microbacterium sp. KUDC0406]UJP10457.1 multidrug ABC transporter ATPase [Microbacterium sp. KUDC0406]